MWAEGTCPPSYSSSTALCKSPKARKRCPKGYSRSTSKFGPDGEPICVGVAAREEAPQVAPMPSQKRLTSPKSRRPTTTRKRPSVAAKRCPKGTRRNKSTGRCEPRAQEPTILDSGSTRPIVETVKGEIAKKGNGVLSVRKLASYLVKYPYPAYSPDINRKLISMKDGLQMAPVFGCGAEDVLEMGRKTAYRVFAGYGPKGTPRCVSATSDEGQKILLTNLARSRHIDCAKIIPPLQFRANCWLNSFLMAFIVSDLGRKFFRHLRFSMITGQTADGAKIQPPGLRTALLVFNACIEAIYGNSQGLPEEARMVRALDTNTIIDRVYKAIKRSPWAAKTRGRRIGKFGGVAAVDQAGVPAYFFLDLIAFLGRDVTQVAFMAVTTLKGLRNACGRNQLTTGRLLRNAIAQYQRPAPDLSWDDSVPEDVWFIKTGTGGSVKTPDVIILELGHGSSHEETKKGMQALEREPRIKVGGVSYTLGACAIRDFTLGIHFTALLFCGGKPLAFDGASFTRLVPLPWAEAPYLTPRPGGKRFRSWEFTTKSGDVKLQYNFGKSYQILLYFRTE